jgi:cyclopropane fatty-acyl-phospholipid synthase-like methyltransferase
VDIDSDLYGKALLDFYQGNYTEDIIVLSTTMEDDVMPLPYLFRSFEEMPALEKKALQLARGKTLDIGAGAGIHSLYLQEKGLEIIALDQSKGACKVLTSRLQNKSKVIHDSIWNHTEKYDTILLLMNGTGIFSSLKNVSDSLEKLKRLLNSKGQILIDSSDLKFLFEEEDDGGLWVDSTKEYYGEVTFSLQYKGMESEPFEWLYMDFELLKTYALKAGFKVELVQEGKHHDYLARLSI